MKKLLNGIKDHDFLGRAVFSKKQVRKNFQPPTSPIKHTVFLETEGERRISVDRFGFCSEIELTSIQDQNAEKRSSSGSKKRSFHGWAKIQVINVLIKNKTVEARPQKMNPYHADIVLPEDTITKDIQTMHAKNLADHSQWTPRPDLKSQGFIDNNLQNNCQTQEWL